MKHWFQTLPDKRHNKSWSMQDYHPREILPGHNTKRRMPSSLAVSPNWRNGGQSLGRPSCLEFAGQVLEKELRKSQNFTDLQSGFPRVLGLLLICAESWGWGNNFQRAIGQIVPWATQDFWNKSHQPEWENSVTYQEMDGLLRRKFASAEELSQH